MKICGVILVGNSNKGTRFRPLSLDNPKSMFSICGKSIVDHQIEYMSKIEGICSILVVGNYENIQKRFSSESLLTSPSLEISYINEGSSHGTAAALYHLIKNDYLMNIDCLIVCHGDVVCEFPFQEMVDFYQEINKNSHRNSCILSIEVPKSSTSNFGALAIDEKTFEVLHYVEKSSDFKSNDIHGGIGVFGTLFLDQIKEVCSNISNEFIETGIHIFPKLVAHKSLFAYKYKKPWVSVKSPNCAIHANRLMLSLYNPPNIIQNFIQVGKCYIDPSAVIDPTAHIGPDVSIGPQCVIKAGVRIINSIILKQCIIKENIYVKDSIIGEECILNPWSRIQGENTEDYFEHHNKTKHKDSYFTQDGRFNPSITVLGSGVVINPRVLIYDSIILPRKEISSNIAREIIL